MESDNVQFEDLSEIEDLGFHEDEMEDGGSSEDGVQRFLLSFLERAIKDYLELDPEGIEKNSEYSDGFLEKDEWNTAFLFLFEGAQVMEPWNLTFTDICEILDINQETILERIAEAKSED